MTPEEERAHGVNTMIEQFVHVLTADSANPQDRYKRLCLARNAINALLGPARVEAARYNHAEAAKPPAPEVQPEDHTDAPG